LTSSWLSLQKMCGIHLCRWWSPWWTLMYTWQCLQSAVSSSLVVHFMCLSTTGDNRHFSYCSLYLKQSVSARYLVLISSLQSIKPSLLYGLEACPLVKSDLSSLDFVINRFFMKLLKTNNIDVVKTCQQFFNFVMPSTIWTKRSASFERKFSSSENVFCKITQYTF